MQHKTNHTTAILLGIVTISNILILKKAIDRKKQIELQKTDKIIKECSNTYDMIRGKRIAESYFEDLRTQDLTEEELSTPEEKKKAQLKNDIESFTRVAQENIIFARSKLIKGEITSEECAKELKIQTDRVEKIYGSLDISDAYALKEIALHLNNKNKNIDYHIPEPERSAIYIARINRLKNELNGSRKEPEILHFEKEERKEKINTDYISEKESNENHTKEKDGDGHRNKSKNPPIKITQNPEDWSKEH